MMSDHNIPEFSHYFGEWGDDLQILRQNRLLDEPAFIRFATERGIKVEGLRHGDPEYFYRQGWLTAEAVDEDEYFYFHPFRIYSLHRLLLLGASHRNTDILLHQYNLTVTVEDVEEKVQLLNKIEKVGKDTGKVTDLLILLEPIYWPDITEHSVYWGFTEPDAVEVKRNEYRIKALELVSNLDPNLWQRIHESLRRDAAFMDRNSELYLLLRASKWEQREKLQSRISYALWLRHMAEVLRLAFEEVHRVQWDEEDRAVETWYPGGRTFTYGAERPLDDLTQSRPRLAWNFGLLTGSAIRWYVEGKTERFAIQSVIPKPADYHVEIVDLRGDFVTDKHNVSMKLNDNLKQDKELRRFSMISFDCDRPDNAKKISIQIKQGNVIGYVTANNPDFEFANFTIEELVELAAIIDEAKGFSGDAVRNANWTGIHKGGDFEEQYVRVSDRRPPSLKGEEWGCALAAYAMEHSIRPDNAEERPFNVEIRNAYMANMARYDYHKAHYSIDPETFKLVKKEPEVADARAQIITS